MIILSILVLTLILFIGINVLLAARRAATFPKYWQDMAAQPVPANAIRLIAIGDSIMEAIGATPPADGIARRIANHIVLKTGWPVHVTNVSVGGATTREIIDEQLPQVEPNQADLIILATTTDPKRRVPLDTYETNLQALLWELRPAKTILIFSRGRVGD